MPKPFQKKNHLIKKFVTKGKKILVISDSKSFNLGIGDHLRIACLIPNLNCKKVYWLTDKDIKIVIENCTFIQETRILSKKNIFKYLKKIDIVLNLTSSKVQFQNTINLDSLLDMKDSNSKKNTYELIKSFKNYFNLKKVKIFSNNKKNFKKKNINFFFASHVPQKWKIKALPEEKWNELEKKIKFFYPDIKILKQDPKASIKSLIKSIKDSDLVIGVVGLAIHLSALFNKKTIMLSGPTNFFEIRNYDIKTILPDTKCQFRPCNLINGIDNCGCMPDISIDKVFREITKINVQ